MKNAKELMLEYTAFSFKDPKTAAEMFAEDGAFELPYLALPDHWIKFPDAPLLLPCYDLRPGDCFSRRMCNLEERSAILEGKIIEIPCYFPC